MKKSTWLLMLLGDVMTIAAVLAHDPFMLAVAALISIKAHLWGIYEARSASTTIKIGDV